MKVKLDENIPVSLAEALASLGHDVQTVIGDSDPFLCSDDAAPFRAALHAPEVARYESSNFSTRSG